MATTRLMPRHVDKGHSILQSISDSLTYGQDLKKTRDGKLVSSYECNLKMAADEFVLAKRQYSALTGREQRKDKDVLLYQLRQSFRPGEISLEEANRLSYELALSFTKGRHAFSLYP